MSQVHFLDMTEGALHRYVFEVKGKNYTIRDQQQFSLSDSNDLPVNAMFKNSETTYLSLPISSLNFRVIGLPFSDRERIREVLPFELDGMILGGTDTVIFDAVIVGKTDSVYQVLAVYIEKNRLRKILDTLHMHGIDPAFITSLELKNALKGFSLSKLVPPVSLAGEERIVLAGEEMRDQTINLRRNEFSYVRDVEKVRRSLKVTAVLCAIIVFVMGADILFRILSSRQQTAWLRNEMRKSYLELFPEEKTVMNELHQLKAHIKELRGREEAFIGVKPLNVLSQLAQVERQGARFHEVTIERDKLIFRGESGSLSGVQELQEKLKKYFDEVSISDSKTSVQGTTVFSITAKERKA